MYSYQVPRYSCQNISSLPTHLCLYRADFFISMSCFINQESLVPSISKRKRESENQPYNKQHGGRPWQPRISSRVLRKLILHVCVHNAPQRRVSSTKKRYEYQRRIVETPVALSYNIEQLMTALKTNLGVP